MRQQHEQGAAGLQPGPDRALLECTCTNNHSPDHLASCEYSTLQTEPSHISGISMLMSVDTCGDTQLLSGNGTDRFSAATGESEQPSRPAA